MHGPWRKHNRPFIYRAQHPSIPRFFFGFQQKNSKLYLWCKRSRGRILKFNRCFDQMCIALWFPVPADKWRLAAVLVMVHGSSSIKVVAEQLLEFLSKPWKMKPAVRQAVSVAGAGILGWKLRFLLSKGRYVYISVCGIYFLPGVYPYGFIIASEAIIDILTSNCRCWK